MTGFVLDASVALRWFLASPVVPYARRVRKLILGGAQATVPALWHLEIANGLAVAERRGILSPADVDQCVTDLERLLSQAIRTDPELAPIRETLTAARAFGLSSYDAAYLRVAQRERLPLATLDEALRAAAAQSGVGLVR